MSSFVGRGEDEWIDRRLDCVLVQRAALRLFVSTHRYFVQVPALFLIVWLCNNTGQSVFAAALFHATLNLTWMLFPVYGSHFDMRLWRPAHGRRGHHGHPGLGTPDAGSAKNN